MPVWLAGSDRRLRLLACACCRENWKDLKGASARRVVEIAEGYADRNAQLQDLTVARVAAFNEAMSLNRRRYRLYSRKSVETKQAIHFFATDTAIVPMPSSLAFWERVFAGEGLFRLIGPRIIRDIFGNPFRPVTLDPRWLTSTVLDLARTIYDEFPRQAGGCMKMPILADALMDAGCDSEDIINHCRGPAPHVRGCFVVDLILGKE
jgi:hypothetical protein